MSSTKLNIDVIVCTYNRPDKLTQLVNQLLTCNPLPNKIIVIDSSDEHNRFYSTNELVKTIVSSHKNQPYQRFLGCHSSNANYLLYLDDDMEIISLDVFEVLQNEIAKHENLAGLVLKFEDKHEDTSLSKIPKSNLLSNESVIKKIVNWITCYPILPDGKFGLCGNRGKQPLNGGQTEWLSGGAFLAKRDSVFKNFNVQLFDLFEQKLGMGEDAIIGYGLSKQGHLIYFPSLLFYHNDQKDSTYSTNQFEFAKRVIYSRLYISLEKIRLDKASFLYGKIYFHWYVFCRILGLFINYLKNKNKIRKDILSGSISGWKKSFTFRFHKQIEDDNKWLVKAKKDSSDK